MKKLNSKYVESVVKKAVDGKIASRDAAAKLGVSRQYVNRLKKAYGERGAAAFEHGNKDKSREWKTDGETEKRVIELYSGKYAGFNFAHFLEKLSEDETDIQSVTPIKMVKTPVDSAITDVIVINDEVKQFEGEEHISTLQYTKAIIFVTEARQYGFTLDWIYQETIGIMRGENCAEKIPSIEEEWGPGEWNEGYSSINAREVVHLK